MSIQSIRPPLEIALALNPLRKNTPTLVHETRTNEALTDDRKVAIRYDIHNMSLADLDAMASELYDSGQINIEDWKDMSVERSVYELCGVPRDKTFDLASSLQERIDTMKTQPQAKGVAYVEHVLDILQGVDARSKARIPASV